MLGFFFSGPSNMGNQNRSNPFQFRDNTYVSAANLTWVKGKHSTRYGMEYDRFDINHFQPQNTYGPRGRFDYSGGLTACGGSCTLLNGTAGTDGSKKLRERDQQLGAVSARRSDYGSKGYPIRESRHIS